MENLWWLYLIMVLPQIALFLFVLSFIGTILFGILAIIAWIEDADYKKSITILLFISLLLGFLSSLIPSKEGLYTIIAGVSIIEVAKTDAAKRMSEKSIKIIENWLDQNLPTPIKKETK